MNENKTELRRLYRSNVNRMIGGVCGGVSEYASIDPTVVRVAWALSVFWGGVGVLLYVICLVIMPENPKPREQVTNEKSNANSAGLIAGVLLVLIGLALLSHTAGGFIWPFDWRFWHFWPVRWRYIWPVLLMLIGVWIIAMAMQKEKQASNAATEKPGDVPPVPRRGFYRSRKERMFAGVCGGLARYWRIDVALIRIGYALLTVTSGFWLGIGVYLVIVMLVPEEAYKVEVSVPEEAPAPKQRRSRKNNPEGESGAEK